MTTMDFGEWYRREHPRLVSALTVVSGEPTIAAEAADEAFVRAYERWARVGAMTSPFGWTYRTAVNLTRRRHRRAAIEARIGRRSSTVVGDTRAAPADWSPEVWDLLRRLPDRQRAVIALRYIADLSTAEIAETMGIAEGTVGSTLHAAKRNLAAALSLEHRDTTESLDTPEASDA